MEAFPELSKLMSVIENAPDFARVNLLTRVEMKGHEFPIYSLVIGTEKKEAPTLGLFGGVHGLERIGSQCVLAFLESLFEQLRWDAELRRDFENCRIVSIPIINPAGMYFGRRSNPNGVDLMRNSPVSAQKEPAFLLGGHRYGPFLPWYRGPEGAEMEKETRAVIDFVAKETFESSACILLDVHSGFGIKDRLWYPFAKTSDRFPSMDQVDALVEILNRSYPNHVYLVEPQSLSYTTHGDLWDHVFELHYEKYKGKKLFMPWTLEMGSWIWVKKNPFQLISEGGMFNPVKEHRYKRTLRRHMPLFNFLMRAVRNQNTWWVRERENSL